MYACCPNSVRYFLTKFLSWFCWLSGFVRNMDMDKIELSGIFLSADVCIISWMHFLVRNLCPCKSWSHVCCLCYIMVQNLNFGSFFNSINSSPFSPVESLHHHHGATSKMNLPPRDTHLKLASSFKKRIMITIAEYELFPWFNKFMIVEETETWLFSTN